MANDNVIELIVKVLDEGSAQLEKLGGLLGSIGKLAAGAFAGFSLKEVIEASVEAQNASFLLANAIKAVGLQGTTASEELTAYAEELQRTTTFSDGAAKSAEALGVRLGLSVDVIKQAVEASADLAAANPGQSLEQAFAAVGRALADPLRGIQSLRREHVVFNQEQQFTIENLAKTGQQAEAQAKILAILRANYAGAAHDARDTLGGALLALKNNFVSLVEVKSSGTGSLVGFINDLSAGLSNLKAAMSGTLTPTQEVSAGMKLFASTVIIAVESVKGLVTILTAPLFAAFKLVGTLIGGFSAAMAQAFDFKSIGAGDKVKDIIKQTFSDVGDIINKSGDDTVASLTDNVNNVITTLTKLWSEAARIPSGVASVAAKNGGAVVQLSIEQLRAINEAQLAATADINKFVVQAATPFADLQQQLYLTDVTSKLASGGIKDLSGSLKALKDGLTNATDSKTRDSLQRQIALITSLQETLRTVGDARGDAARADVLQGLNDSSAQLAIQSTLGIKAADAMALYAANLELAAKGGKDLDNQIADAVSKQQLLKNDVVVKQLQDQLSLEQLTTNEKEKQSNLQKLGVGSTADQKKAVEGLTEQLQLVREQTNAVNGLQDAFVATFEQVGHGANAMKTAFLNAFEAILAKALALDLVNALGLNKLSSGNDGGTGTILGSVFGALFAHAGGGTDDKPFWAGENGPELIVPGGTTSIWNQRQMAFSGAGGGGSVNYAPTNNINIVANDANQTKAELLRFITVQSQRDREELYRTLRNNGVGPRTGLR